MGMGRKEQQRRQEELWIAHTDLPRTVGHPFYEQLNRLLEEHGFDEYVEQQCARFYAEKMGRPSLAPGRYFRLLLVGYFEGIDSERGIAWRAADSLGLRSFLGVGLNEMPPDHSTISRTRRLIDVETHRAVFGWVLELLAEKDLLKGKTIGIPGHLSLKKAPPEPRPIQSPDMGSVMAVSQVGGLHHRYERRAA